jgi:hypothetical protein
VSIYFGRDYLQQPQQLRTWWKIILFLNRLETKSSNSNNKNETVLAGLNEDDGPAKISSQPARPTQFSPSPEKVKSKNEIRAESPTKPNAEKTSPLIVGNNNEEDQASEPAECSQTFKQPSPPPIENPNAQSQATKEIISHARLVELAQRTKSLTHLASTILVEIFKRDELLDDVNVKGMSGPNKTTTTTTTSKRPLDPERIEIIRAFIMERSEFYVDLDKNDLWTRCVKSMNSKISKIRTSKNKKN